MKRLFGSKKEEPAPAAKPSLEEAAAKIDLQIQNLEAMIAKADAEIRENVAKGATNPTAKSRAMQGMKKKKMYEQQRDQLLGTQFNVETLKFQQDQADITVTAVAAMTAGQQQLKAQTQQINVESVDKLRDDMEDLADDIKQIGEALGGTSLGIDGVEDDELAAEFAKMEEEEAAKALMGVGMPGGYATASSAPAPGSAEEEYAKLLAAMGQGASAPAAAPMVEASAPPA